VAFTGNVGPSGFSQEMKTWLFAHRYVGVAFLALVGQVVASTFQTVSIRDLNMPAPAGAGGDSSSPVISEDGRFVLFTSTAENLASNNISPVTGLLPRRMNVFLRDRLAGTTVLVSARLDGLAGGNGDSTPAAISTNGQFTLFESAASDLVSGDTNNARDIFVRDTQTGTTTLISVSTNGGSGNGLSRNASLTSDGRFVVFASAASNLVANDTNSIVDVFVRDGQTATTTLVSVGAKLVGGSLASRSDAPEITPDGRYVVFYSTATNLIPGMTLAGEIYVRDLVAGTTTLASTNARSIALSALGSTNVFSCNHSISADGRYVAFEVATTNANSVATPGLILRHDLQTAITDTAFTNARVPMMPPEDIHTLDLTPDGRFISFIANTDSTGVGTHVRCWDSQSGTNTIISLDLGSNIVAGAICDWPLVDASGRYVAFLCNATNLTTNALTGEFHWFVRDTLTCTTTLVDVDTNGIGAGVIADAPTAMSRDGRYVAFDTLDNGIVANDRNRAPDVFLRDLTSGTSELISMHHPALPTLSASANSGIATFTVSTNGRYAAFSSDADDLVPEDRNGYRDVFVRDLISGTTLLVSVSTNGSTANGMSFEPFISVDGRYVAFTSTAKDLTAGDTNSFEDVFVRDLLLGTTKLASVSTNNTSGNGDSRQPTVSADGRHVTFFSEARNLVTGASALSTYLFARDMTAGTNRLLLANIAGRAVTPDGSKVAFAPSSSPLNLHVWNSSSLTTTTLVIGSSFTLLPIAISPNGQRVAYRSGASIKIASLQTGTNWSVITNAVAGNGIFHTPSFSFDGRFLAFANLATNSLSDTNAVTDIYLHDSQVGTNLLVSRAYGAGLSPNALSDSPSISRDGRFIAYRSRATNIAPTDFNETSDIFLFDRINNATILVSTGNSKSSTANHFSKAPIFSSDGQTLLFQSWASDLKDGDYNQSSDLFALSLDSESFTDSDNDLMDDSWEQDYFKTLARDGAGDFDSDGANDLYEFQSGTNPADPHSSFSAQITTPIAPGENPQLSWPMQPWRTARVQFKNDLSDAAWQDLVGNISIFGTNGAATDLSPAADKRFYRIILSE
jgi:hypothetical protein